MVDAAGYAGTQMIPPAGGRGVRSSLFETCPLLLLPDSPGAKLAGEGDGHECPSYGELQLCDLCSLDIHVRDSTKQRINLCNLCVQSVPRTECNRVGRKNKFLTIVIDWMTGAFHTIALRGRVAQRITQVPCVPCVP